MSDSEIEWLEVVEETREQLEADPKNVALLFKQGQAYFNLEEYETSVGVLKQGLEIAQAEDKDMVKKFEMWIRKCNVNLSEDKQIQIETKAEPAPAPTPAPTPAPAPAAPAVRHEWFQSTTHVSVTFFCKDRAESDVEVEYKPNSIEVTIKLGGGKEFQHTFSPLYAEIVPSGSSHTVGKYKIEIKLQKVKEELHWRNMERSGDVVEAVPAAAAARPHYPSSRPVKKDWDKMVSDLAEEEKDEKEEGDAALNKLFKDIYGKADEATRMAMNKSFQESGGTVLSTNWAEVGAKHVDGTPPKGMEFRKYGE